MDNDLVNEIADDIFGQFFRIGGALNNIEKYFGGVNLFDITF